MDTATLIAFATAAGPDPDPPLWTLTDSDGQTVAHAFQLQQRYFTSTQDGD